MSFLIREAVFSIDKLDSFIPNVEKRVGRLPMYKNTLIRSQYKAKMKLFPDWVSFQSFAGLIITV